MRKLECVLYHTKNIAHERLIDAEKKLNKETPQNISIGFLLALLEKKKKFKRTLDLFRSIGGCG
jgi:hypothetical protein